MSKASDAIAVTLGVAGVGVLGYVALKATGVIEPQRAEGADFIMDTFTLGSTKTDFIRGIMSAATRVDSNLSARTRLLLASWAALESGWGKTRQAKQAFNLWNISAGSAWLKAGKPTLPGSDTEYRPGSTTAVPITQQWRAYPTLEAAVSDLLSFLKNSGFSNYRTAYQQLLAGDVNFAAALGLYERDAAGVVRLNQPSGTGSFYTKPRSEYVSAVVKLARDAEALVMASGIAGLMAGTQS